MQLGGSRPGSWWPRHAGGVTADTTHSCSSSNKGHTAFLLKHNPSCMNGDSEEQCSASDPLTLGGPGALMSLPAVPFCPLGLFLLPLPVSFILSPSEKVPTSSFFFYPFLSPLLRVKQTKQKSKNVGRKTTWHKR